MRTITIRARSFGWFVVGVVTALVATVAVMSAWRVDAAPGDEDATFVPITPCRLLDTREPAWNIWGPNVTQSLLAHGTNGACTIPTDAVGLSMNVTAVRPTEPTFLTIWPDDQPRPDASSLNPVPGQPPTPNAVTTELAPNGRFKVYNLQGHVHVIIDVNGYYARSSLQEIDGRLARLEASARWVQVDASQFGAAYQRGAGVQSVDRVKAGVYEVVFFEPVDECAWFANRTGSGVRIGTDITFKVVEPGEITVEQRIASNPRSLLVRTYDSAGTQTDMSDGGFSLLVAC
jgi:hypothetical protein